MGLTPEQRATYDWQLNIPDFGEEGQEKLSRARVLISRVGGVGGLVAYELAAAGVGTLVLAHGGVVRPGDLNRQLLVTHESIGTPRLDVMSRRLLDFNPRLNLITIPENIHEANAAEIVSQCDLIVDCAPLFEERFAMNRQSVLQHKPMVECAMFELEAQLTTFVPGESPCLECLFPEPPPTWKRKFPVLGAVSGSVGCLAAIEAIKMIAGFGTPLIGRLLRYDTREMRFNILQIHRRTDCSLCGSIKTPATASSKGTP